LLIVSWLIISTAALRLVLLRKTVYGQHQSKTTNLSAVHFFGDLDNAIRRKRNASLRHQILIKQAKKQGRTLRKEEQSKDKTARSRRQDIIQAIKLKKREKGKK
jgi:hypothetical protein